MHEVPHVHTHKPPAGTPIKNFALVLAGCAGTDTYCSHGMIPCHACCTPWRKHTCVCCSHSHWETGVLHVLPQQQPASCLTLPDPTCGVTSISAQAPVVNGRP
jgi:hypothetical protein